jgi:hypothetical protein
MEHFNVLVLVNVHYQQQTHITCFSCIIWTCSLPKYFNGGTSLVIFKYKLRNVLYEFKNFEFSNIIYSFFYGVLVCNLKKRIITSSMENCCHF